MNRRLIALLVALFTASAASAATNLTGTVVGPDAKPVRDGHVYVYTAAPKMGVSPLCPSCYRDCGKQDAVDGKGRFALNALDPSLKFNVLAVAPGYEPAFASNVDPLLGPVTIRLAPRAKADAKRLITGSVIDPDGKPVVGAMVEPSGVHVGDRYGYGNIPGLDKLSITDAKGEFALRIPEFASQLDVRVLSRSFAPLIDRNLVPGQPRKIRVADGSTVSGHVMRDGRPVEGARVVFVQRNRNSSGYLGRVEIGTNEQGLFVMTNLAPKETYLVYVPMGSLPAGIVEPKTITTGAADESTDGGEWSVTRGRRIAGALFLPEGVSLPEKTHIILAPDDTADVRDVLVHPDGSFVFDNVSTGALRLHVRIPGLKLVDGGETEDIAVPAGGDVTNLGPVFERP